MRKSVVLSAAVLLFSIFGISSTATAYTVTYSSEGTKVCPANATMQGEQCYCNVGYKVDGTKCVRDEGMPLGKYEIYEDIRMTVTVNDEKNCDQLGMIGSVDLDMCKRFKATPDAQKIDWKTIPRPVTVSGAVISNPWAPPSQQSFAAGASSSQIVPPLPPPEPPPAPTSTPATVETPLPPPPVETKPVEQKTEEENPAQKALAETKPTKFDENLDALKNNTDIAPLKDETTEIAPPAETQASTTEATSTQATTTPEASHALNISSLAAGLVPVTDAGWDPTPEDPKAVDEQPAESPSILGRIANWFFSLF